MKKRILTLGTWLFIGMFLLSCIPAAAQNKKAREDAQKKVEDPLQSISFNAFRLRSIGPALTSGRIADFAVNPKNKSEYYVATASGGVWNEYIPEGRGSMGAVI